MQASGHGAGAPIDADQLLVDTSALNTVRIDADRRQTHIGAGATWSAVNTLTERHGLFGLAGTSPTVSVCGYTFGGGVGFLTRPYGMASSALLAVDYVDGTGQLRRAAEDADALSTSLSVLRTPPGAPMFPPALQGVPVVHLAFASSHGSDSAAPLLDVLRRAPAPVLDSSWAPADAARLAHIHLDPPDPVPALGTGRWLDGRALAVAADLLRVPAATDSSVAMVELRNLDNAAPTREGALTAVPAPYLLHAVGTAGNASARARTEGLSAVRAAAAPADIGRSAAPFADGRAADLNGLDQAALHRLARISAAVDPGRRFAPSRILKSLNGPGQP